MRRGLGINPVIVSTFSNGKNEPYMQAAPCATNYCQLISPSSQTRNTAGKRPWTLSQLTSKFLGNCVPNWLRGARHYANEAVELAILSVRRKVLGIHVYGWRGLRFDCSRTHVA